MFVAGNSNVLSQHLQNLSLHQPPVVNVPQNQGELFTIVFKIFNSFIKMFYNIVSVHKLFIAS